MSRTLKKKKHWTSKVVECAVSWGSLGEFGSVVEILGGAEGGEFPFLGQMKLDVLVCHVGKLPYYGDVLLEVNGTPVSGLTNRDTLAVIRHFREPVRLKTVKPAPQSPRSEAVLMLAMPSLSTVQVVPMNAK
ncbi:membrane-associated guanylate kinase, WW and PDZ domain-containing protein 3-like [Gadus chalcogrammus]|uniref:membrane-associated guanylate kinase, WW and PDZ domain-containing protein 3-like n=1 Tax=Gadus chalcogrammus TaxID=1042646 RepID=UPI0024C4BE0A|nr:membrane-associated guanylate kinase, WW and PDZ domain-containing protein 3-like [Gadus chalcogrammus]